MIKNFRVTVNGTTYDVGVEDLGTSAAAAAQTAAPAASQAPAPVAAPSAPAAPPAPAGKGSPVPSPMPGIVLDIKVAVGDRVEKHQTIVLLEAMKMENEIVTPTAGTVTAVMVSRGDSINAGDTLVIVSE